MYDLDLLNLPNYSRPGICEGHEDPDIWHSSSHVEQAEAKRICGLCPAKDECLTWALDNSETLGIWGGLTPRERHNLKRRQGRPTKARTKTTTNPRGTCRTCGNPAHNARAIWCVVHIHGTNGGRRYHTNHSTEMCEPCRQYERDDIRTRKQAKRQQDAA